LYQLVETQNNELLKNEENMTFLIKNIFKAYHALVDVFGETMNHHDLHPDNILVSYADGKLIRVTIIDFDDLFTDQIVKDLQMNIPVGGWLTKTVRRLFLMGNDIRVTRLVCYCCKYIASYAKADKFMLSRCRQIVELTSYVKQFHLSTDRKNIFFMVVALRVLFKRLTGGEYSQKINDMYDSIFGELHSRNINNLQLDFDKTFDWIGGRKFPRQITCKKAKRKTRKNHTYSNR
jgi:hypothetical protein